MDVNVFWLNEKKIQRTIEALEKNNMRGFLVESKEELVKKIEEIVHEGATVSCGGSMTLAETGVMEHLRSGRYNFLDRDRQGITMEEKKAIYRGAFSADAYFTSTNAITENGELYNVDGNGNRVAAMLYGPDKVIVVCGVNKIVKDLDDAIKRAKEIAAPTNAKRLNKSNPCSKTGYCMNCKSQTRICNEYTLIKRQVDPERINIIFLNESLGY
ncbi:lactate utilization protein [uncultured Clostridium sp.]|uniref:lactate utilization protein n=1 Tax=uncultured Clostridium sp. TaxID=59620 RepID=UPI002612D1AA|nr:lactate utilization protein [uncultured Clostridium sp.]